MLLFLFLIRLLCRCTNLIWRCLPTVSAHCSPHPQFSTSPVWSFWSESVNIRHDQWFCIPSIKVRGVTSCQKLPCFGLPQQFLRIRPLGSFPPMPGCRCAPLRHCAVASCKRSTSLKTRGLTPWGHNRKNQIQIQIRLLDPDDDDDKDGVHVDGTNINTDTKKRNNNRNTQKNRERNR